MTYVAGAALDKIARALEKIANAEERKATAIERYVNYHASTKDVPFTGRSI